MSKQIWVNKSPDLAGNYARIFIREAVMWLIHFQTKFNWQPLNTEYSLSNLDVYVDNLCNYENFYFCFLICFHCWKIISSLLNTSINFTQVKYCEDLGITAQSASRLFIFIGLTSSLARILSGKLCNNPTINPVFVYQLSLFIGGVSVLLLPYATKYWALVVFSCAYGASDGIFISTANYILLSCVDEKRKTAAFYIECLLYSFSVATGGPIAGKTFSRQICRGTLLRLPKPITSELSTISFTCICYPRIYFTLRKDMDISYLTL